MPDSTANGHATREPGALFDSELLWRDRYQVLENRGYRLRPRYRPDWVPSWKQSGKDFFTVEDGQPTLVSFFLSIWCLSMLKLALVAHGDGRNASGR
jgi:hypothetical protein